MLSIGSGLLNIGNSCFFNATLQALFYIPSIAKCLQVKIDNNEQRCECVSCVFLELYNNTRFNKVCDPRRLYSTLYNSARKKFGPILNFQQQDAHEFLILFSEYLESELHSAFSFDEIFVSNIVTDIECSRCKNVFKSSCIVYEFQLVVFGHKSVKNALHSYFNNQSVDYDCEKCNAKVTSKKKTFLLSAPQCIMLTLKRYNESNKKLNSKIEVTRELKLSQYFSENQALQWNYKLVTVVNHIGKNLISGHYSTIACKEGNDHYEFDDSNVNKIESNKITGENEYMLFYEYIEEPDEEKYTPNDMESNEDETDWDIEGLTEIEIIDDLDSSNVMGQKLQSPIDDLPQTGDIEQWAEVEFIENIDTGYIYNLESPNSELEQWTEVEIIDDPETSRVPDLTEYFETASELRMNQRQILQSTENEGRYEMIDGLQNHIVSDQCVDSLSGRRIVDIDYLFNQMLDMTENVCKLCNEGRMIFSNELKRGLISIFTFRCEYCGNTKRIESTPVKNNGAANPNEGSVLGIVSIGLGFYHLQELLSHLNIKCMSYPTFHKLEKRFQADWWKLAKKFEADALNEEIRLAKENLEVDSAGNALIGVEFDGSWEKRAYTNNFSSLAGCAAIIGRRTNKIIYSGVKTKYCHVCKIAESKNTPVNKHECNANYVGPSSGMETAIIIEGFKFCEEKGARFHYYVGDGDCSTYKALRDLRLYKNPDMDTEKFECENHLFRNFTKKCDSLTGLTKFKKKGRKLLPSNLGRNICKGVRMASRHWREVDIDITDKYENLERDIMNAPMHYIGVHDNCEEYFCQKQTEPGVESAIAILKETGLYYEILDLCQSYFANNVKSLIAGYSTNKTEGFNSLIAKNIAGKRICNSTAGSYKGRTATADVQFNTGGHSGSTFHDLIFGDRMESCLSLENTRKRKVEKNAIARDSKPKKRRLNEETSKKNKKPKRYGLGREDVDKTPAEFELAKKRFLESVSENQFNRDNIEIETRAQRLSLKWLLTRRKMVTTSYFGRILNVRNRKSYTKIVEEILYKDDTHANTADIRHQRAYEREALDMFSQVYRNESIEKCGLFIDEEFGFLGASPFRLYGKDGIVMVKCPKKAFNKSINEAITKKMIPIWTGGPENRQLNIKSHWYIELQGQLHITRRHMGYLLVYLGESVYEILELERNDNFWKENMEKELIFFFNEALLKEIVDPRDERGMDLREYNAENKTFL